MGVVDLLKSTGRLNTNIYLQKLARGAPILTFYFLSRSCNKIFCCYCFTNRQALKICVIFRQSNEIIWRARSSPHPGQQKLDKTKFLDFLLEPVQHLKCKQDLPRISRQEYPIGQNYNNTQILVARVSISTVSSKNNGSSVEIQSASVQTVFVVVTSSEN